jgi:hypothetical protein
LAALVVIAAFELKLAKQVSGHPVNSIELTFFSAIRTGVWILLKPLILAIGAEWLLTLLALYGVFKDVIAYAADELLEESLNVTNVVNFVFFVDVLLVLF